MGIGKSREIAIFAVTVKGAELGRRLKEGLGVPDSAFPPTAVDLFIPEKLDPSGTEKQTFSGPLKEKIARAFKDYQYLVLIMASGIAVRLISPLVQDKHSDPGVVVVDDGGTFAISLLSGHVGGANELARRVAECIGAKPVITTASDVLNTISADILGKQFGWEIEDDRYVTSVSAALVNGEPVGVFQDAGEIISSFIRNWPANIRIYSGINELIESRARAALIVTDRILDEDTLSRLPQHTVFYRPQSLVAGIGCNRGTSADLIEEAVKVIFAQNGLSVKCIRKLATIDLKKDETGILDFSRKHDLKIDYFGKGALQQVMGPSPVSEITMKHIGVPAVSESAALLSSRGHIIIPKTSYQRAVTIAVARQNFSESEATNRGRVYIIGTGPGHPEQMTFSARAAIEKSEIIVGYHTYVKLIEPLIHSQQVVSTGMGAEIERVKAALELARKGHTVSVISSGDAGVYGMAGLMGELLREKPDDSIEITVIPGIPALAASAALLGAPLTGDFACISLSDHLVSWEKIRERLDCASKGDFVIVLYNPKSRQRQHQLDEARAIILNHRPPATPVGVVTNAYRDEQTIKLTDLAHLPDCEVNMNSTVIVGNSSTFITGNWMVTPRGYSGKYEI